MGNMLSDGSSWLFGALTRNAGVKVTVRRGGQQTANVDANVGRSRAVTDDGRGAAVETDCRDYLVDVAAYKIGGQPVEPQAADQITETIGGVDVVFEVLPFGDEPPARHSDPQRLRWRIHTKRISGGDQNSSDDVVSGSEFRRSIVGIDLV